MAENLPNNLFYMLLPQWLRNPYWFLNAFSARGGALRVKISRGARLEVQNGTQQDLNEIIDLVNLGGKKIVYMLKMGGFEMGPNKIWIKW